MKARRILCTLLVLFVCVAALATKADAAYVSGDWEYGYYEGDIMITGYNGSNVNVTVPSTIEGLPVVRIDNKAFDGQSTITSVTLPDSVKTIGEYAFRNCAALRSISFSAKLQSIARYAFDGCVKLNSITLPKRLETIGYCAFNNCKGMEKITIQSEKIQDISDQYTFSNLGKDTDNGVTVIFTDTVTHIPGNLFNCEEDNFTRIKRISVGKNVMTIASHAFADCPMLEEVTFADGCVLTKVEEGAFERCYKLVEISLPSKLESIGKYAFEDCTNLPSITLPKPLTTIGYHAFNNCKNLEKITIKSEKMKDISDEDTFRNVGMDTDDGVEVVFTNAVTHIPANLFNCKEDVYTHISSISIGKNVLSIGSHAFADCQHLVKVTFADGCALTTIGEGAFERSIKLVTCKLPSKLESIGKYAFESCTSLNDITLPKALMTVGYHAFYNCRAVKKITVNSTNLQNLDSSGKTFYNVGKDIEDGIAVTFASAVGRIPSYMFDGDYDYCPNIRKVSIGKGVTYIGYAAFRNCPSIKSISFDSGSKVSKIDGYAFEDCDRVTTIVLPNTVTEIGSYAFNYCDNLSTIRFSGNYPKINNYAFNQVSAKAYYPKSNATWTSDKLVNYGGIITWKSYSPATISTQPKTGYAQNGETVKVTVKAKGEGLKYQWYIRNADQTKYSKSSVTGATYSCTMSEKSKDRRIYCVITDKFGNTVQTKTVMLRMEASIITQPKNTYTKSGSTVKVPLEAMGDELTYTWYIKNAGASKYSKSSVTKSTYSCKMSDTSKDRYVYCVVEDEYGNTVKSKTVVLRMAATITKQPKSVTVEEGEKAKVTVKAVGDGLTYQWYIKNPGKDSYSKSSVTSATYSCKMTDAADGRRVYCVVTDAYGKTAKSNTVTLSME